MWQTVRAVIRDAIQDFRTARRGLVITDLAYKAIAFAILMPAGSWLIYSFRAGTSDRVVADVDIARFLLTTPAGIATVILATSIIVAITTVEVACLMAIGYGQTCGVTLNARTALRFGLDHALKVLGLSMRMILRVIGMIAPLAIALGLVYTLLLDEHDINYYLSRRPPEFLFAIGLAVMIGFGFLIVLLRTIARWIFALPILLFEGVPARHVLAESAGRASGSRAVILLALAVWIIVSIVLVSVATALVEIVGRAIAPQLAGSLALLLLFFALLLALAAVLALAVGVVNIVAFSMIVTRLYLRIGMPETSSVRMSKYAATGVLQVSGRMKAATAAIVALVAIGVAFVAFLANRGETPAVIIAHRGASAEAPENTLAAFRLAADHRTDFIELDVQESADGEVLVVHDADLMKVGGDSTKIWEGQAAHLRSIDVGGRLGVQFSAERVPTLAEALAVCKGRCKVIVELKSYGHNDRLEERVVRVVEEAGMVDSCVFMSLDHAMVNNLKALRPSWRVGLLVAKAIGDLTELQADFLAVEARMATPSFVRRAHRNGKEVFIWTVNDPAWMLVGLSRGVDGLITDKPELARLVLERRAKMSDTQRFLIAQLIRLGASTESLEKEDGLRP